MGAASSVAVFGEIDAIGNWTVMSKEERSCMSVRDGESKTLIYRLRRKAKKKNTSTWKLSIFLLR